MTPPLNLIGRKIGRLTVMERVANNSRGSSMWLCKCDCGNKTIVCGTALNTRKTLSCGCLQKEAARSLLYQHGETNTRLHNIWKDMRRRCSNPRVKQWKNYGGRGITVCDEWEKSFPLFKEWAMSAGYRDDLSLDRIDNNGGYCPENCRWVDSYTQSRNRRNNILVEYHGETKCLGEWVDIFGYRYGQCRWYVVDDGYTWEQVVALMEGRKQKSGEEKSN